jgi:hypothetical protein
MNSMAYTTRLIENDGTLGEDSNHDGDGDFIHSHWPGRRLPQGKGGTLEDRQRPQPPDCRKDLVERMHENECTNFRGCTQMYDFFVVWGG